MTYTFLRYPEKEIKQEILRQKIVNIYINQTKAVLSSCKLTPDLFPEFVNDMDENLAKRTVEEKNLGEGNGEGGEIDL